MRRKEEDNEEGTDNDSARGHASESIMEQSEDAETEDDDEASDTNQMHDLDVDDQSAVGASENTSSFTSHVGHKLSKEEVDNLTRRKWKYNWDACF